MPTVEPQNRLAEDARRGRETFDRHVRPMLQPADDGKFVAIDIDTAGYEIDADDYSAVRRLLDRLPAARVWLVRAGHPATYRFGPRTATGAG